MLTESPVKTCAPVAPWQGGKSRLAAFLTDIISRTPHTTYAEPFVGMGGVFFRREFAPKSEVINDYSRDVSNLSRILQRHYDREDTLFYMDPPYFGCESDYGRELFNRGEFALMAELLKGIKGKFLLSLNDTPEVREIFAGFEFLAVRTAYTLAGADNHKQAAEVVIANYTDHSLL